MQRSETATRPGPWKGPRTAEKRGVRVVSSGLAPIVRLGIDGTGDFYTIGGAGQECSARYTAYFE